MPIQSPQGNIETREKVYKCQNHYRLAQNKKTYNFTKFSQLKVCWNLSTHSFLKYRKDKRLKHRLLWETIPHSTSSAQVWTWQKAF